MTGAGRTDCAALGPRGCRRCWQAGHAPVPTMQRVAGSGAVGRAREGRTGEQRVAQKEQQDACGRRLCPSARPEGGAWPRLSPLRCRPASAGLRSVRDEDAPMPRLEADPGDSQGHPLPGRLPRPAHHGHPRSHDATDPQKPACRRGACGALWRQNGFERLAFSVAFGTLGYARPQVAC